MSTGLFSALVLRLGDGELPVTGLEEVERVLEKGRVR
jgi:hypothetical protein